MDDLTSMLSQVLSDPESMQQIQSLASSLGFGNQAEPEATPAANTPQTQGQASAGSELDLSGLMELLQQQGGGQATPAASPPPVAAGAQNAAAPDLSALLRSLGDTAQPAPQSPPPAATGQTPDLSALSGLIQNLTGNAQKQETGADVQALTHLLQSGQPAGASAKSSPSTGGGLPFDMNTLLKLQKAMSTVGANKSNIDLLMALKPRLNEERAKKIDDAVRVMQLVQFLPLIKESGLFGDTSKGLGGLVGGLGDGINNVLGGLFGGGRR